MLLNLSVFGLATLGEPRTPTSTESGPTPTALGAWGFYTPKSLREIADFKEPASAPAGERFHKMVHDLPPKWNYSARSKTEFRSEVINLLNGSIPAGGTSKVRRIVLVQPEMNR